VDSAKTDSEVFDGCYTWYTEQSFPRSITCDDQTLTTLFQLRSIWCNFYNAEKLNDNGKISATITAADYSELL